MTLYPFSEYFRNRLKQALVVALLVSLSGYLYADPAYRIPHESLSNGERGAYVPQASYEVLGVSIASGELAAIREARGKASLYEGHHGANHLCYVSGSQKVDFMVSTLGFGYEVTSVDKRSPPCATTAEPVASGTGLEIGMSQAEATTILEDLLGEPGQIRDNTFFYTYWVQEPLSSKSSEDYIQGDVEDVTFEFCELKLDRRGNKSTINVHRGGALMITMPFQFSGYTVVKTDYGKLGNFLSRSLAKERVALENPAFEERYEVFGSDQQYARYLLSPALMERIIALDDLFGHALRGRGLLVSSEMIKLCLCFHISETFWMSEISTCLPTIWTTCHYSSRSLP